MDPYQVLACFALQSKVTGLNHGLQYRHSWMWCGWASAEQLESASCRSGSSNSAHLLQAVTQGLQTACKARCTRQGRGRASGEVQPAARCMARVPASHTCWAETPDTSLHTQLLHGQRAQKGIDLSRGHSACGCYVALLKLCTEGDALQDGMQRKSWPTA